MTVEKGSITSVIGANGAGKTTLLSTISGLVKCSKGRITFLGEPINSMPPHKIVDLGISHVPERRRLFPSLTVIENLRMGAYAQNARKSMGASLELVYDLFPFIKQRSAQLSGSLSGGEQQMLAVARGLMGAPRLLMLDEPLIGLAPMVVADLVSNLKKINEEGITVVLVEQNAALALQLADHAYVLETGRVVLSGAGKELMIDPRVKHAYLAL